jgi:glycosyltransferase involved in cell wall biosynthesis
MRIGVLYDALSVNPLYRAVIPMRALEARGHDVRWNVKSDTAFDLPQLLSCDVVHIHRYWDADAQRMARRLRENGVAIWWDNDDDISAVPRESSQYKKVGGARGAQIVAGMTRMMAMADLVTTPSEVLAERYRALGVGPVEVLENLVPDHFPAAARLPRTAPSGTVVIGWTAGQEHRLDLDRLGLRATLQALLDRRSDVEVVSAGLDLGLSGRYRHVPRVHLHDLATHNAQDDIAIAPLADIAMNQARSNIKVKEYAVAGVPWLASPVAPYLSLGEKQGGRLVPDADWPAALDTLVDDARARRKLAKRAAKWGAGETIGRRVQEWEGAVRAALASGASATATSSISTA